MRIQSAWTFVCLLLIVNSHVRRCYAQFFGEDYLPADDDFGLYNSEDMKGKPRLQTVTINGKTCFRGPINIVSVNLLAMDYNLTLNLDLPKWYIYLKMDDGDIQMIHKSETPSYRLIAPRLKENFRFYVSWEDSVGTMCDLKLIAVFLNYHILHDDDDKARTSLLGSFFTGSRNCVGLVTPSCENEPILSVAKIINYETFSKASDIRMIKYNELNSVLCLGPKVGSNFAWYYENNTELVNFSYLTINESMSGAKIVCKQILPCSYGRNDVRTCALARSKTYTLQYEEKELCRPTPTKVRWGKACGGQLIFEDNFDSLDEDVWQVEQYARSERPEHAFCSRQRGAVSAAGGLLRVAPRPQRAGPDPGVLDLRGGCTAAAEACLARAQGAAVLPPVASGRLTSRGFAFKYGTVEVRARLPRGDWLYPELLLEPLMNRYGSWNEASGALRLAGARGNEVLYSGSADYSNGVLYGGPVVDSRCRDALMSRRELPAGAAWGERFHVFTLRWTPDELTLGADGAEWYRVVPQAGGLHALLPPPCDAPPVPGAPPPGALTAGGRPKPWRNQASKAMLDFSRDIDSWLPTWNQSDLLVDYIRIRAL